MHNMTTEDKKHAAEAAQPASTDLQQLKALAQRIREANCRPMEVSTLAATAIEDLIARIKSAAAPAPSGEIATWGQRVRLCPTNEEIIAAMEAEIIDLRAAVSAATKPTADAIHTPMRAHETRVYLARNAGGFDLRDCPDPEKLAAFIASACNLAATKPTADLESIEQYRLQMAAIGTAALGYWKESDGIKPEYDTVPLRDVAKLYAKYESLLATKPAAQAVPEGFVLMPQRLTAENGAKGVLSGEFYEEITVHCPECDGGNEHDHCEQCGDEGNVQQRVPVSWDTIKRIYKVAVDHLAAAPAAPLSADAAQEQAPREVWSNNNEDFNFDTLDDLLDDGEYKPGDTVWVGEAVKPELSELIDADDVVDQMADRAGDIAGDHADGYPDVSKDDKHELNGLLSNWIERRCPPNFYRVENVKPYRLSADDFPNDRTSLNAEFGIPASGTEGAV